MGKTSFVVAVLLLAAAVSCGSEKGIKVTLDEYSIELPAKSVGAGPQTFSVSDRGQIAHQFIVLRTNREPGDLPVAKDGIVKLEAKGLTEVGQIEILTPGQKQTLDVDLRPGRYVFICNIAGHYASGMHAGLTAR